MTINSQIFGPHEKITDSAECFFCIHSGPSMNPTLAALDLLEIESLKDERPQVGDIILFQPSGHRHYVVHRIIAIGANGIRTRGDNNCNIDPDYLSPDDILGKVIVAHGESGRKKIRNGVLGRITGTICHTRRFIRSLTARILGPAYRSLCRARSLTTSGSR